MSTLLLVRHGQARPFETDSDRLTERGEAQARTTGEHLVAEGLEVDEVYTGTLTRQQRTAEIVGSVFRESGRAWPEPRVLPAWNEYPADDIVGRLLPAFAARDARFGELVAAFQSHAGAPDRNRYFQRMFEVLMAAWQSGEARSEGVEPFEEFHDRVRGAIATVTGGSNVRVLVFTSGGPIGVTVQEILEAPQRTALSLNFRVKNASLTEIVFGGGRVSLDVFNSVAHLPETLRTFR